MHERINIEDEKKDGLVLLECMFCGQTWLGPEPQYCCSGRDCGCMGMPVDPIVCSEECYDNLLKGIKGSGTVKA